MDDKRRTTRPYTLPTIMSKIIEQAFSDPLELKPQHLDAIHLIDKFMLICRDTHQTQKHFGKSMNNLYEEARKFGF